MNLALWISAVNQLPLTVVSWFTTQLDATHGIDHCAVTWPHRAGMRGWQSGVYDIDVHGNLVVGSIAGPAFGCCWTNSTKRSKGGHGLTMRYATRFFAPFSGAPAREGNADLIPPRNRAGKSRLGS